MTQDTTVTPDFGGVIVAPVGPRKEMLSVRREGNRTTVRINSSSLGLIQTCARKSFYSLHEGWRGKQGSPPLIYGSAIHKALEVFYRHTGPRTMPENFNDHAALIGRGYVAPAEHFLYDAVNAFVTEADALKMLPDDDKRSIQSGIWLLGHYFRTYLNDSYVIHTDSDGGPVTERPFETVISDDGALKIILFGTIDFALRNTLTGEVLVGDHKTTSMMGWDFMARTKPNHQYTGYLLGAQRVLGISSENFLVNGIEVKALPKTARGGPPKFIRQITRRTPEDFAEFEDVLQDAVTRYLDWSDRGRWPLGHVDACAMWGGCTYHDVCSAPNELRDNILTSKFTKETHA